MEEELITLDTAKLAKEKGFREFNGKYYQDNSKVTDSILARPNSYDNSDFRFIKCSQSLLAKWLRENYNIFVTPSYTSCGYGTGWHWVIYKDIKKDYQDFVCSMIDKKLPLYDNFEEAFENGLQEALKLIK